jgi:hypothetical protein
MQERHVCAQAKATAVPLSPASCPLGRAYAVFHFFVVAVDQVTAARTHVFLRCFIRDLTWTTPSCRHYIIGSPPTGHITSDTSGPVLNLRSLANTSWNKGLKPFGCNINMLSGKYSKLARSLLRRHDVAVSTKRLG